MVRAAAVLVLVAAAAAQLSAAATLDGVSLGTAVCGPSVTPKDLQGHVVLFEYWGVHCPPCLASIEHLAAMQKRFGRDTFVIVANHCQGEPAQTVNSTWHAKGGGDEVSVVMEGGLPGADVSTIPRCFLFDSDGKLVYDGHPMEVEDKVVAAVKSSPGALVVGHAFAKLGREAAQIGACDRNLAPVIKTLRKDADSADAATKDDATFLLGRLTAYASDHLERIKSDTTSDPLVAATMLARMVMLFKGDDLGKPFLDVLKTLKADKAFQRELQGADMLAQVQAEADKIGLGSDPDAKHRTQDCEDILEGLQGIQKRYSGTMAARKASELQASWGL